MNRRIRNRTYGGVGGREPRGSLLPDMLKTQSKTLIKSSLGSKGTLNKKRADIWKPKFLVALRDSACVRDACEVAGIDRRSAYKARDKDESFAADWADALEDACDTLELALRKRAINRDTLASIFLLKAHRPDKFRETTRTEITGAQGGPIEIQRASDEFDSRLSALMVRVTKTTGN